MIFTRAHHYPKPDKSSPHHHTLFL